MYKVIIERNKYLERIIAHKLNRKVKIITGIRRCGKSFIASPRKIETSSTRLSTIP